MVLTRDLKETVQARARRDTAFRRALPREGVESLLAGVLATRKTALRDYIDATLNFEALGALTRRSPRSLVRMFGPSGNLRADNLFDVIVCPRRREGISLEVRAARRRAAGLDTKGIMIDLRGGIPD